MVKLSEEISLRADERHEMIRILQELSERVRPHAAEIANDAWIIGHLDLIRAKVRFIQERQAVVPQLSENQEIQLLHRHPWSKMQWQTMYILVRVNGHCHYRSQYWWEDHHAQNPGLDSTHGPVRLAILADKVMCWYFRRHLRR